MPSKQKNLIQPQVAIEIPVIFNVPIEMPSVYATNVTVQATEHEVLLSFYEAQPPIEVIPPEELKKIGIRADCVTRITVARGRFDTFASVIGQMAKQLKDVSKDSK